MELAQVIISASAAALQMLKAAVPAYPPLKWAGPASKNRFRRVANRHLLPHSGARRARLGTQENIADSWVGMG